jgi:putative two-component system response regulator
MPGALPLRGIAMLLNPSFAGDTQEICSHIKELTTAKILVVDDDLETVKLIENLLRFDGFRYVRGITNSHGALAHFLEFAPDMVLLDLNMPAPDGFMLLRLFSPHTHPLVPTPIIVLTAEGSPQARTRALSSGATDYVTKPFLVDELLVRVRNQLRTHFQQLCLWEHTRALEREIIRRTQELESYELELRQTQLEVTSRLAKAAEHRDDDTGHHTQRVGLTCFLIAQEMRLPAEWTTLLRRAAPLHDVGKIGIPDAILRKPGKLDLVEWQIMQRHSRIGADLLSGGRTTLVQMAESIAMSHHERWDGTGYPHGLRGEEVPLEGRILAVADVFDALIHDRPYKRAWSLEQTIQEIRAQRGLQFDPDVVDAFLTLPHIQLA